MKLQILHRELNIPISSDDTRSAKYGRFLNHTHLIEHMQIL